MPLVSTGIFIVAALCVAWLDDGPLRARRYPFIYVGAVSGVSNWASCKILTSSAYLLTTPSHTDPFRCSLASITSILGHYPAQIGILVQHDRSKHSLIATSRFPAS